MSVEYFNCEICEEIHCDCESYRYCSNCDGIICEDCYPDQIKKYGKSEDGGLKECDACSEKTKPERIKKLKRQLRELI